MNILDDPIEVVLEFICSKNRIVEVIRVSADHNHDLQKMSRNGQKCKKFIFNNVNLLF